MTQHVSVNNLTTWLPKPSSGSLVLLVLIASMSLYFLGGDAKPAEPELAAVRRAHYVMGTVFEITAYGEEPKSTADAEEEAFGTIRRADEIMSHYRPESDLSRLNQNGANAFVPVPSELYFLLRESVKYSRLTGGAFDITVSPLVGAWQEAAARSRPLAQGARRQLLSLVGASHLLFDPTRQVVQFDRRGVRVELSAIAKGWAVDRAASVLRKRGIKSALISAGESTLYALGSPPGQPAWKIGIRHPLKEEELLATIRLKDESLSTSANYENFLEIQGKKYSHILDPRTGIPVEQMLSATVLAPTGTESDALSTATFVLGMEGGERLLRSRRLSGILARRGKAASEVIVRRIDLANQQRSADTTAPRKESLQWANW